MTRRGMPGRTGTVLILAVVSLFSAAAPAVANLYQLVYPFKIGSNVLDSNSPGASLVNALKTAKLAAGFDGNPAALTENVPARYTATVTLGSLTNVPPENQIQVAIENEASLTGSCLPKCAFDIDPNATVRQRFQTTNTLTWHWMVTPRLTGSHVLVLSIQPVLILPNSPRTDLEKINKAKPIVVNINPNHAAHAAVAATAATLSPVVPAGFTVGDPAKVTATLPLDGYGDRVHTNIRLAAGSGSVPATITQVRAVDGNDQIEREWEVTAQQAGPVNLAFQVDVSALSGDRPLKETVSIDRSVHAADPPPSVWDRLQAPVLWVTPFLVLAGAALGVWKALQKRAAAPGGDQPGSSFGDDL